MSDGRNSMLGFPYVQDDRVVLLTKFLADYLTEPHVEIEAKIGTYSFRHRPPRISHITLLDPEATPFSFQSAVDANYFETLRRCLREQKLPEKSEKTEDLIYDSTEPMAKERKTVNVDTQVIVEVCYKSRLYDLNFLLNADSGLGVRISANKEYPIPDITSGRRFVLSRRKDRSSFTYEYLRVDMTEVQQRQGSTAYEVEIEISDPDFVRRYIEGYRMHTDRNSLYAIGNKFWQNVLAVAQVHAPAPTPVWNCGQAEQRAWEAAQVEGYRAVLGGTLPLVGDYLYTVAGEMRVKGTTV